MYKIAVIGTGYVGLTTAVGLANLGSSVLGLDISKEKIQNLSEGKLPIYEPGMKERLDNSMKNNSLSFSTDVDSGIRWADIIFIAVGTPQKEDGQADLTSLYTVAKVIAKNVNGYKIIVIKSTVPVGTNEKIKETIIKYNTGNHKFDIVSNPEFLREGKAMYDFFHPDRIVIGTDNERPVQVMKDIYKLLYLNNIPFVFTDFRTSELIKYSSNCFLAMKVGFINEMARLCDAIGANITTLGYAMGKDGRIGSEFLQPGPGYGGSCFPKDTNALAIFANDMGISLSLTNAVIESNLKQKLYAADKIKKHIAGKANIRVAVLGLAFKAETDDIRESPSIAIINELLKAGAAVCCYDPQAMENARSIWQDRVEYAENEYAAAQETDIIVILTEWQQFKKLDLQRLKNNMRGNIFLDFRNIYKANDVRQHGFIYEGMGKNK